MDSVAASAHGISTGPLGSSGEREARATCAQGLDRMRLMHRRAISCALSNQRRCLPFWNGANLTVWSAAARFPLLRWFSIDACCRTPRWQRGSWGWRLRLSRYVDLRTLRPHLRLLREAALGTPRLR